MGEGIGRQRCDEVDAGVLDGRFFFDVDNMVVEVVVGEVFEVFMNFGKELVAVEV